MSRFATLALILCTAFGLGLCVSFASADDQVPEPMKPSTEHAILKNFVGEWDCEMEMFEGPGKATKHESTMSGRMIGDLWANATFSCMINGKPFVGMGTFGFDAKKKKANGTWVDSMTDFLWSYDGKVEGKKLILDAIGPSMADPTKLIAYRDTWDFSTQDKLVLTGEMTGPDGKLMMIMRATGTRKK